MVSFSLLNYTGNSYFFKTFRHAKPIINLISLSPATNQSKWHFNKISSGEYIKKPQNELKSLTGSD